jgi:hypothetical protein
MAISSLIRAQCNKMVYDFDNLIGPLLIAKKFIRDQQSLLQGLLSNYRGSAQSTIDNGIGSLRNQAKTVIPGATPEDMQALKNFMRQCEYLNGTNPISTLIGSSDSILNKINSFVDNIGVSIPEFNLAKIISALNDLFSGSLTDLVKGLDKLLNCLAAFCGGEYPSQISDFTDALNTLYSELNIKSDPNSSGYGTFDFGKMMDDSGISSEDQDKINQAILAVEAEKIAAQAGISKCVDAVKSLTSIGGFFPL